MKYRLFIIFILLAFIISCVGKKHSSESGEAMHVFGHVGGPCKLTTDMAAGVLNISSDCGVSLTGKIRLGFENESGALQWVASADYPNESVEPTESGGSATYSGHPSFPNISFSWKHLEDDGLRFDLKATNPMTASSEPRLAGAELISAQVEDGGGLQFPDLAGRCRFLQQGYDPWSFSGLVQINLGDPLPQFQNDAVAAAGNNDDQYKESKGHSWWMAALKGPDHHATLVTGALSAKVLKPRFAAWFNEHTATNMEFRIIAGFTGESLLVSRGKSVSLDPFYLAISTDPIGALENYAKAAAAVTPPRTWEGPPMDGWASWYDFFDKVTEEDVLKQLPFLQGGLAYQGYRVVQLDDGYMPAWGDWQPNDKFPSGLDGLADAISKAGFIPGIWMAPFLVQSDLTLTVEHPDWFLKDYDGNPIVWTSLGMEHTYFVIDPTHPDAAAWVGDQIRAMVDAGYRYLKLDFLFAAAYEGDHYETGATSLSAFNKGMKTIREAAGEDVYILASGEPLLPALGHVHAARTGTDITTGVLDMPLFPLAADVARYSASKFFTDQIWFHNDPDNICIRGPLLILEEAKTVLAGNLLGGSARFLGDDLTQLPSSRFDMLLSPAAQMLSKRLKQARPLDLFDSPCKDVIHNPGMDLVQNQNVTPSIWLAELEDGSVILALFSFDYDSHLVKLSRDSLPFKKNLKLKMTDLFTGAVSYWGEGAYAFKIQPTDVLALHITPVGIDADHNATGEY